MKDAARTLAFVVRFVVLGLAVAFVVGLFWPGSGAFLRQRFGGGAPPQEVAAPAPGVGSGPASYADAVAKAAPSVVNIYANKLVTEQPRELYSDPVLQRIFSVPTGPARTRRQQNLGSGVIVSDDGYVLTNNHVIANADDIQLLLYDGRVASARVVGSDDETDLAVLKVDAGNLPAIHMTDADSRPRVGDVVLAIGNPFGIGQTVTMGIVSAIGRQLNLSSLENFIQTDAAINFGNSGGPLLNIAGEVIAINTAIRGGGAQGIGFATPINTAKTLLPQLKEGKVVRGYIGISITDVTEETREAFNLPEARGALVQSVEAGKPADKAGLRHGDVVIEADGKPIRNNRELIDYISYRPVGSDVKITVLRNGQRQTFTVTTAQRPNESEGDEEEPAAAEPVRDKLGMTVQNVTAATRTQFGLPDSITSGVVVTSVKDVSAAGEANMNEGDVITEVQGQRVNNVDEFRAAIDKVRSGQRVRLYVTTAVRGGQTFSTFRILTAP